MLRMGHLPETSGSNRGKTVHKRSKLLTALVAVAGLTLAACGGDDGGSSDAPATDAPATEAPSTDEPSTDAPAEPSDSGCPAEPDTSLDAAGGEGLGALEQALQCAEVSPLAADGDPIVIGIMNPEGDPNGSFPEYTVMAQAAVDFINEELGGIGADYASGTPGRPIKLEVCKMAISPVDSQKCANELASKNPLVVYSTLNFFGNHFPILVEAGIPVVVGTPISPADFTTAGVYAIGGGGGCLGVHTGLIQYATQDVLGGTADPVKVAVPWANTPPGVFCYHDLEKKPMNVLNGSTASSSSLAGSMPGLEHIGVPILPGQADVTPDAQKVLDFGPDVVIYSGQGADCWSLVNSMLKLGWTPDATPLVLSGACTDLTTMSELGDKIKGVYLIGSSSILVPDALPAGQLQREARVYNEKGAQYASDDTSVGKGFGTQGFTGIMAIWQIANSIAGDLSGESLVEAFEATKGHHAFAGSGISCQDAIAPYVAVCNSLVSASQWDGSTLVPVKGDFSGLDLVAGTELDFGS